MAERTKRGDEERAEEDKLLGGESTGAGTRNTTGSQAKGTTTTRDKGTVPADDDAAEEENPSAKKK